MAEVVEKEVFESYKTEVEKQIKQLKSELEAVKQQPKQWYHADQARALFVGKHGNPVHRHTFRRWIMEWIKNGDLKMGENVIQAVGSGYLIGADFLAGKK